MVEMRNKKFWSENLNGRNHLEDLGVDVGISECIFGKQGGADVDWIHLAQDRNQ